MRLMSKSWIAALIAAGILIAGGSWYVYRLVHENKVLNRVIARFTADSRAAEVLVTKVEYNEKAQAVYTTIKFLEYDAAGKPLEPRYFTFPGNIIQFQSMVIRFEDIHIRNADALRGKSAYLFWKVFMLDGEHTVEYPLTEAYAIPEGYRCEGKTDPFERLFWSRFWEYALDPHRAQQVGIKNAQIEAPGTLFKPGILYTIRIEHDGGLRIDAAAIPDILKGELILH